MGFLGPSRSSLQRLTQFQGIFVVVVMGGEVKGRAAMHRAGEPKYRHLTTAAVEKHGIVSSATGVGQARSGDLTRLQAELGSTASTASVKRIGGLARSLVLLACWPARKTVS